MMPDKRENYKPITKNNPNIKVNQATKQPANQPGEQAENQPTGAALGQIERFVKGHRAMASLPGCSAIPIEPRKRLVYGPENARLWASVGLMLGQRRRRWPNIKPTLCIL